MKPARKLLRISEVVVGRRGVYTTSFDEILTAEPKVSWDLILPILVCAKFAYKKSYSVLKTTVFACVRIPTIRSKTLQSFMARILETFRTGSKLKRDRLSASWKPELYRNCPKLQVCLNG